MIRHSRNSWWCCNAPVHLKRPVKRKLSKKKLSRLMRTILKGPK